MLPHYVSTLLSTKPPLYPGVVEQVFLLLGLNRNLLSAASPNKSGVKNMPVDSDGSIRSLMTKLIAEGLKTETDLFPYTSVEFSELLDKCRDLADDDIVGKMVLTG